MRSSSHVPSAYASQTRSAPTIYRAASIFAGAGGRGARVSSAPSGTLSSSIQVSASSDTGAIMGNEKMAMQNLNDRLASYLEMVRNLEQANSQLEIKIREALEKSGPEVRDYSRYNAILDDLRKKVSGTMQEQTETGMGGGGRFQSVGLREPQKGN